MRMPLDQMKLMMKHENATRSDGEVLEGKRN